MGYQWWPQSSDNLSLDELSLSNSYISTSTQKHSQNCPMGYGDSELLHCLSSKNWVKYADLQKWLLYIQVRNYFDDSERNNIVWKFNDLKREPNISNETKRFPVEFYVCLGNTNISNIILRIMGLLGLPLFEDVQRYEGINLTERNRDFGEAVKDLNVALCSSDYKTMAEFGIFCRKSFEQHYSLIWNESDA
ncbi:uncharacterized protein LOC129921086 [Episyrphus balteatus]|uniref:uncharacterized protein LOC129921086 n=1 Tax=Episyrphus balteatus TaxID=286459 RepID=UPI0024851AB7|nr:uncharacterized protein LOC129921086 [Episyrphus balteatus]